MNSIVVKEFDILNEAYLSAKTGDSSLFKDLISFVEEYNAVNQEEDAYSFMSISKNRQYGEHITFKNYVGVIEIKNKLQIEVLPKIDMVDDISETKKIFTNMLRSMKDFNGKLFNISSLNVDKMNIYEIFISFYLQEVLNLVKHGLKSDYINTQDDLNVLKGKLIIKDQIRKNNLHKERFMVSFDEYSQNRVENRIIKATLLKLLKLSSNEGNKKLNRQLLSYFENVDASTNYDADFNHVVITRANKDYDLLMKWSKVFLKNKSFTTFSGEEQSRALLFPMEKLFESYVAKYVKRIFNEYYVTSQDKGYYLFSEPSRKFALRPDIVIKDNSGSTIIMDTKWKKLNANSRANYGISQSDMYQMYAYAKKYNTNEIWLLYPQSLEMKNHHSIEFKSNDGVKVNVYFIDLKNIEESLNCLLLKIY